MSAQCGTRDSHETVRRQQEKARDAISGKTPPALVETCGSEVTTNKPLESFYDQVAALLSSASLGEEEVKLSWFYPPPPRFIFPVALFITM